MCLASLGPEALTSDVALFMSRIGLSCLLWDVRKQGGALRVEREVCVPGVRCRRPAPRALRGISAAQFGWGQIHSRIRQAVLPPARAGARAQIRVWPAEFGEGRPIGGAGPNRVSQAAGAGPSQAG